jgi:hypothetical protein
LGPAVGEWTLFNRPASAIIAAPVGLLACMLPQRTASRLWPALAWLAPLCSIAAIAYLLRGYVTQ